LLGSEKIFEEPAGRVEWQSKTSAPAIGKFEFVRRQQIRRSTNVGQHFRIKVVQFYEHFVEARDILLNEAVR